MYSREKNNYNTQCQKNHYGYSTLNQVNQPDISPSYCLTYHVDRSSRDVLDNQIFNQDRSCTAIPSQIINIKDF